MDTSPFTEIELAYLSSQHLGRLATVAPDGAPQNKVSISPWEVRGLEIRGVAEPLGDAEPPLRGMSRQVIRIHPRCIISWNVGAQAPGMVGRNVADQPRVA